MKMKEGPIRNKVKDKKSKKKDEGVMMIWNGQFAIFLNILLLVATGFSFSVGEGVSPVYTSIQKEFYVSPDGDDSISDSQNSISNPFKTLERARQAVDTLNDSPMTGDIIVYFLEGTYTLDASLTLDGGDSGNCGFPVIYKDYPDDTGEAVVSGGVDLTGGWTLHDAIKNIYKRTGVDWRFRQLYVNGRRAVRSREPDLTNIVTGAGYYSTKDSEYPFSINTDQIGMWADNGVTEFVWNAHWSQNRGRIDRYTTGDSMSTIHFKSPEKHFPLNHHNQEPTYFYFENAYELLDAPGEWFLDKKTETLYYKPRAGEIMGTTRVIAPKTEILIALNGTTSNPVHHVRFHGITFKHNNWTLPDEVGFFDIQGGHSVASGGSGTTRETTMTPVPGMADIRAAHHIRFERNIFESSGSWGIMEYAGSHHNTYIGNVFRNLSAGAITIGNGVVPHKFYLGVPAGTGAGDIIKNNLIKYIGRDYRDAVAIMALKVKYVTIKHNEIRHTGYTGISIGLEWGDTGKQDSHHNVVSFNRIQHVMQVHDDGGGIYALGRMSETTSRHDSFFHHNFVYNIVASPFAGPWPFNSNAGIYLDGNGSYQTYHHNVVDNAGTAIYAHGSYSLRAEHDNIGKFNHFNVPANIDPDSEVPTFIVWTNNVNASGSDWAPAAKSIMDAAGIQKAYRDIGRVTIGANVAQGRPATASSVSSLDTPASEAVDNNVRSGLWASDGVQPNPYWQVDLGKPHRLYQVDLIARQDVNQPASRRNFEIQASNDSTFDTYSVLAGQGNQAFQHKGTWTAYVDDADSYRYLRVQRTNNTGYFSFTEFRAYGTGVPPLKD